MALHKVCKYLVYPKNSFFVVTNLMANIVFFILLPEKVYPDAINELQYRKANMQMNVVGRVDLTW